jgi:hypothetical protein
MIYRKLFYSIPIYGIFLILLTPYTYASGPRLDSDEAYDQVPGAHDCWVNGYDEDRHDYGLLY